MAWDHLDIDKPHLAYMILGGFTTLFMLCSLFVKERLYIGEATVATLCGVIFGPHAAGLFDPISWGNVDKITLECSRIVLVVQCFAVGVELPKSYMERHWKSVILLLLPVMTWGWLVTSLFIWWMVPTLSWLESLACAACVTATDPVLASSVVGKGKFAKRVPKHLRDLLSAESGCNDGMAFPFIYLAVYIMEFRPHANEVSLHWFCYTILYECVVGAIFGFVIGYIGRHAIKFAEKKNLIDRESFLVFYFVLALFCAGSGSLLGMDDLLMGFSAGVGFSNDGWFTEKTEESHVSNVIDLLLNLAYFVYFGSIIPWEQYHVPEHGLPVWRLVVIAIFVIFFRRIPIMLILKPIIPDVKTWREALFAGHFGPIGVGAIFACILARAELETESTQPLAVLPHPGEHNYNVIALIWPITTFMVISSILVHGSSIAVFTLGKRINTLTITMSYTQANEEGPSWMNRLPRIQSQSKGSTSLRKRDSMDSDSEKLPDFPPGTLPPIGLPGTFLRRQRDSDVASDTHSRSPSRRSARRRRLGPGGPISESAIMPQRRPGIVSPTEGDREEEEEIDHPSKREKEEEGQEDVSSIDEQRREPQLEVYQEGDNMVVEDEEGNVLDTEDISGMSPQEQKDHIMQQHEKIAGDTSGTFAKSKSHPHDKTEGEGLEEAVESKTGHPRGKLRERFLGWTGIGKDKDGEAHAARPPQERSRRSARAYQFANTIIVEDEDGEVIKKYSIPGKQTKGEQKEGAQAKPEEAPDTPNIKRKLTRMGTWVGMGDGTAESSQAAQKKSKDDSADDRADDGIRFTVAHPETGQVQGKTRMNKQDFIKQIRQLDPKVRAGVLEDDSAPAQVKSAFKESGRKQNKPQAGAQDTETKVKSPTSDDDGSFEKEQDVPTYDVAASLAQYRGHRSSAAEARRRRLAGTSDSPSHMPSSRRDSEDDGTERVPPSKRHQQGSSAPASEDKVSQAKKVESDTGETPAELKRRLAALGELHDPADDDDADQEEEDDTNSRGRKQRRDSDSEDDGRPREVKGKVQFADGTRTARRRAADDVVTSVSPSTRGGEGSSSNGNGNGNGNGRGHTPRISWGGERGRNI